MIIQLELSDEISKLIEYIPKDSLSEIIGDLIKDSVKNKSSVQADAASMQANTEDIKSIMTLLENLSKREVVVAPQPAASPTVSAEVKQDAPKEKKPVVISVTDVDSDDLDGLEDMLDMLK